MFDWLTSWPSICVYVGMVCAIGGYLVARIWAKPEPRRIRYVRVMPAQKRAAARGGNTDDSNK